VTRVLDTFLFSGIGTEADLLECRLRELDGVVDQHVIVEGGLTFQGRPKPFNFHLERDRFEPWADRIRYIQVYPGTDQPGKEPGDTWAREHASRQAVYEGLADAKPGDIVLHGDVDEIPSREAIYSLREHAREIVPCKLELRFFMFAVDWEVPWRWHAPSVMRYGQVQDFTYLREFGWSDYPYVQPAGWHLTWLGGEQAAREKVHAFSHAEAIPETEAGLAAGRYYRDGVWWPGRGRWHETQFTAVEVDETWPQWIADSWDAAAQKPKGPAPDSWFRPRGRHAE
jgi:beta-1,4-mannosyl-glycoprotein beta-1,4-N-acetylglucosaminyltransferase